MAANILSSNCPAKPTNGSPILSSSAPGHSPIIMRLALLFQSEKTIFLAVLTRGHLSKDLTADSNSVKVLQLFAKLSASITSSVVININLFLLLNHI